MTAHTPQSPSNPTSVPRTFDEIRANAVMPNKGGKSRRKPNIVIWIMDDVGYGHLSPYGGLVNMPTMQILTDRGVRFTNFHVTPLCAPTRACLLTGRNHHTNHMGSLPRFVSEGSKQNGKIPRTNGFLSEVLLEHGYATQALGKWHLTTTAEVNVAAPRHAWPLGRGFERFYGFLAGQSSQYNPHLVQDNSPVFPPPPDEPDYHLSEDMVTQGIRYIRELRSGDLEKPFFMYLAFAAGHAPHHVPTQWMEPYRGKFDMGWDVYRQTVYDRQKELGIIPPDAPLSQRDPDVDLWDNLPEKTRRVYGRFMEAFAGMCTHMDAQVKRLVDELERLGELDNTIFLVLSDNGASSEGGESGALNNLQFHGQLEQISASLENMDAIGTRDSYSHYPWGWAWAGNTPFRRWKRETYRGGCAVPLVVTWKDGLASAPLGNRHGYAHAIDIVPTLLELVGIDVPNAIGGMAQSALDGTSFAPHLIDAQQSSNHHVQYDEMMGHRAIYENGWRAVCPWPAPSVKEAGPSKPGKDHRLKEMNATDLDRLEESAWELYRLSDDPGESRNLASTEPAKLRQMISRWWHEAGRYGVLPMIGAPYGTKTPQPTFHIFYQDMAPVFIEAAPSITNTDFVIEADIECNGAGTEGMLIAHGGKFGGYGLMVREGRPVFIYNYFGLSETVVVSADVITGGQHTVRVEFKRCGPPAPERGRGAPGILTLLIDGKHVASQQLTDTAAGVLSFTGMLTVGYHHAEPFHQGYQTPYKFNGTLHRVCVATTGANAQENFELEEFFKRQ